MPTERRSRGGPRKSESSVAQPDTSPALPLIPLLIGVAYSEALCSCCTEQRKQWSKVRVGQATSCCLPLVRLRAPEKQRWLGTRRPTTHLCFSFLGNHAGLASAMEPDSLATCPRCASNKPTSEPCIFRQERQRRDVQVRCDALRRITTILRASPPAPGAKFKGSL